MSGGARRRNYRWTLSEFILTKVRFFAPTSQGEEQAGSKPDDILPLGILRCLASSLESVFFTLFDSTIPGKQAFLTQHGLK